jgi:hypothetical protein
MSSKEMSNSMDELSQSSLKSLSKYSCHLFLISSSLVRSRSITSLRHFTWMMSSSSSLYFWPSYRCPFPIPLYPAASIIHHTSDLLLHSPPACGLLCHSVPLYVTRTPIQVHTPKALFLLLIVFYTFSFHHHVSLVSRLPPLVTPITLY